MELIFTMRGNVLNGRQYESDDAAIEAAAKITAQHCGEGHGGQNVEHDPRDEPWSVNVYRSATKKTYVHVLLPGVAYLAYVENEEEAAAWVGDVLRDTLQRYIDNIKTAQGFAADAVEQCKKHDDLLARALRESNGQFAMIHHRPSSEHAGREGILTTTPAGEVLH